jgi:hypothetical protein
MFAPMHALIPPLPADALFALLAPAGPPRPSAMDAVPGLLHELGVNARIYSSCRGPAQLHHLAASDAQRLADLHHALDDPDVHAPCWRCAAAMAASACWPSSTASAWHGQASR